MYEDLIKSAWSEKYRPTTLKDCILPLALKKEFEKAVQDKDLVTSIFAGTSGIGKTTVAKAVLNDIDADYIMINGSKDGDIGTLRTQVQQFASTMSQTKEGRKYVIIDEADWINSNSTQPALRGFIEEFSEACGFIFTCNYANRIMKEIHSRAPVTEFKIPTGEAKSIASQYFKRACYILDQEGVEYDKQVVATLIKQHFPDFRYVINVLQKLAKRGPIDSSIFAEEDAEWSVVYKALKEKNFKFLRTWLGTNSVNSNTFFRKIYDDLIPLITENSVPQLVLTLAQYQMYSSQVADQEINQAACLAEIMSSLVWL